MRPRTALAAALTAAMAVQFGIAGAQIAPAPMPSAGDTTDARALYDAAYNHWHALARSPYAIYESTVQIVRNGRTKRRREDVAYRRRDNRCLVVGIALDARDRPDAPQTTNRCFAPETSFTFLPHSAPPSGGPLPIEVPTSEPDEPLRAIGHVTAYVRRYEPTYVGDEQIGAARTAHLSLRPIRDPSKHILRDMWIDRATLGVVRLHGDAGLAARFASIDFTVDYDETATTQVVRRVTGFAKAQLLLVKLGADFELSLARDSYPAAIPDWYFDKRGYAAHGAPPIITPAPQ